MGRMVAGWLVEVHDLFVGFVGIVDLASALVQKGWVFQWIDKYPHRHLCITEFKYLILVKSPINKFPLVILCL